MRFHASLRRRQTSKQPVHTATGRYAFEALHHVTVHNQYTGLPRHHTLSYIVNSTNKLKLRYRIFKWKMYTNLPKIRETVFKMVGRQVIASFHKCSFPSFKTGLQLAIFKLGTADNKLFV